MHCPANQWVLFHLDIDRTFQRIILIVIVILWILFHHCGSEGGDHEETLSESWQCKKWLSPKLIALLCFHVSHFGICYDSQQAVGSSYHFCYSSLLHISRGAHLPLYIDHFKFGMTLDIPGKTQCNGWLVHIYIILAHIYIYIYI